VSQSPHRRAACAARTARAARAARTARAARAGRVAAATLAAAALVLLGLGAGPAVAATLTDPAAAADPTPVTAAVAAVQDTYRGPGTAGGTAADPTVLMAGDEQLDHRVSYLRFNAPALPPNATNVVAELDLHQVGGSRAGEAMLYGIWDAWDQSTLTAANAPGLAGWLGAADVVATGGVTRVLLAPSRVAWGAATSFGLTAVTGEASAVAFASTNSPDQTLWPTLSVTYELSSAPPPPTCAVSARLVPSCGAWFGSTVNPVAAETAPADALAREEAELGRRLDIVHVFHTAGEVWPTPAEVALATDPVKPRLLLVNWKPEGGNTWAQVAAGAADASIDAAAARVEAALGSRPFFLTIHHEPENEIGADGSGYTPADYVAMYRYVVNRLRADGVSNAVTVWDMMGYAGWGDQGLYQALYPGDDVVDWIGYDPYTDVGSGLAGIVNRPGRSFPGFYTWATTAHPGKPVMLAEFGIAASDPASRAAAFGGLAVQAKMFPALKAFVYFNHRPDSTTGGNDYSFDDDPGVLAAATAAFTDPYFTH
jgi:hypothetical protein